ncbi:hypothetical protein OROMI_011741 [Orobanche minor]
MASTFRWDWSDGASVDISADAYISRTGYQPGICPTGRLEVSRT